MKRFAMVVATCVALVVASSASAYDKGAYTGKHSQGSGAALSFKVVAKNARVGQKRVVKRYVRLRGRFTRVDVTCPDGFVYHVDVSSTDANGRPTNTDIRIKPGGKFSLSKPSIPLRFSGRFAGNGKKSRASGQFAYTIFDVAEHGGDCTSGALTWTARHA